MVPDLPKVSSTPLASAAQELMELVAPGDQGNDGGETGVDNRTVEQGFKEIDRQLTPTCWSSTWPDDSWKGWWGDEPPCHTPVSCSRITRERR